jgi:hypothetical protein
MAQATATPEEHQSRWRNRGKNAAWPWQHVKLLIKGYACEALLKCATASTNLQQALCIPAEPSAINFLTLVFVQPDSADAIVNPQGHLESNRWPRNKRPQQATSSTAGGSIRRSPS